MQDATFFRRLVESANDIVYRADQAGYFTYANPAAIRLTGFSEAELVGMHFTDLVRPDYRPEMVDLYGAQIAAGIPSSYFEFPMLTRSGSEVWIGQNVQLVWEGGEVVGVQAVARDVTAKREVEEALRESEERFRLLVQSVKDYGICMLDPDGRIVSWNEGAQRINGYTAEEVIGRHFSICYPPEDVATGRPNRVLEAVRSRGRYEEEGWRVRKDGSLFWANVVITALRDEQGSPRGFAKVVRDLTAQREAEQSLERSEQYFRTLVERAQDVIHVINPDGTTRYVTPSVTRLLGYRPDELVGRVAEEVLHPDDAPRLMRVIAQLSGRPEGSRLLEVRLRHRDGSWRVFEAEVRNLVSDPTVAGVVINSRDVTARRRVEGENLRLAALSRENPNPVLECDASGRPIHVNPAAEAISTALGLGEITGLLPANHEELVQTVLRDGVSIDHVEVEIAKRIFSWTYRPEASTGGVYLFAVDITGRRVMEEQLRHDALHDALTGLPNRMLFMERLTHAVERGKRRDAELFAVLFLDLDRFKVINDSLGHHMGDELLKVVAHRLQQCLRGNDTIARLGGDEFAVLLEDVTGISNAIRIAERIQAELSAPVNLNGFEVFTSASIGIALSSSAPERPEYLLRNADMAMYRAKSAGQARFEVFDRAMHAQAVSRLKLETDLRHALDRQEFLLHFQPIVELASGRIQGAEALVRWMHPERGLMPPGEFIPVTEETGLIVPLTRWVLEEACSHLRTWREQFGEDALGHVCVNLSARQFSQADLVEQIAGALRDSGLPPGALCLEITESAVMENADATIILLGRLKSLGVKISVDDFGTGYSSLSYLHRFPLDTLKIDRSFVGRIDREERGIKLVQTILALAQSLGVRAVAEGVETEEQLDILRQLGCTMGQGYHFSRPLEPAQMEALLASSQAG